MTARCFSYIPDKEFYSQGKRPTGFLKSHGILSSLEKLSGCFIAVWPGTWPAVEMRETTGRKSDLVVFHVTTCSDNPGATVPWFIHQKLGVEGWVRLPPWFSNAKEWWHTCLSFIFAFLLMHGLQRQTLKWNLVLPLITHGKSRRHKKCSI